MYTLNPTLVLPKPDRHTITVRSVVSLLILIHMVYYGGAGVGKLPSIF